jgi:hypothetical protein
LRNRLKEFSDKRFDRLEAIVANNENDDCDLKLVHVLLRRQASINGEEYIEFSFRQTQQIAIALTVPSALPRRDAFVAR